MHLAVRACRRRPGRRNTRLRTAATTSGVAEMYAFGHRLRRRRRWRCVVRVCASIIACNLAIGSGRPATASGVAILGACSRSGHVTNAQVGEIPGFARLPPPPGWRFWGHALAPGMSPTPRSAKYPVSHGSHRLRGGGNVSLRSSSPPSAEIALCGALVIVSAVGGGADAALRRGIISFIGPIGPIGPMGIFDCKDSGW